MTTDTARTVAFNEAAPQDERNDALAELQRGHMPTQVFSAEVVAQMMEFAEMNKSISQNVVPFPGANQGKRGVQSVKMDDRLGSMQGDWWEKPAAMNFDSLRAMVEGTPILNAVVLTRIRQVQRFCRVQEEGVGFGFTVRHVDKQHQADKTELETIKLLNRFIANCGWEFSPRARKKMRRDSFSTMMGKLTRDSLVLDSCAIETEMKRDRKLGIDGLSAVDGATIRLCPEEGYKGDEDIFALQVIMGTPRSAYTYDDLIYEPRNPRSDIIIGGYGLGETELLVKAVTGFLNAMTHNMTGFDKNAIPKGVLHLSGDYSKDDLTAFRRYWNSMVKGVNSQWSVPVLISKDQESKASFEKFGVEFNEMAFSKWMTFLASMICAIYGMSPSEINFDSFTGGSTSALSGSDTAEKLADSKDKGLRPLLSYFENLITDYVVSDFSDKYVFRWTGLDEEDADKKEERAKMCLTLDEMRAQEGLEALGGDMGGAPLNPSLVGPWLQFKQAAQQQEQQGAQGGDFGEAQEQGQDEAQGEQGEVPEGFGAEQQGDFGQKQGDSDASGLDGEQPATNEGGEQGQAKPAADGATGRPDDEQEEVRKALATSDALMKSMKHGVIPGDEVFYAHPERGVTHGEVTAHGADGFTIKHESGAVTVPWDGLLGHKKRVDRAYNVVEQGEDGALVEDVATGQRHYLAGELPTEDGQAKA